MKEKWLNQIRALGPGLLWAGAAIGVSHLVQSTRAGAIYGFSLVGIVLIANILKYPFFEYGPRYAAATGKSLLDGYRELGNWAMVIFLLLTFGTMFTIQAAVTIVTSGLAAHLFGVSLTPFIWSVLILSICILILIIGRYPLLDKMIKLIIVLLSISTIVAVIAAIGHGSSVQGNFSNSAVWTISGISFMVALMGWMYIIVIGGLIVIGFMMQRMTFLVDIATTLSFLTAPVLAFINYRVVTGPTMPDWAKPGKILRTLSWIGIIFLGGFSIFFLAWKFASGLLF